MKISLAEKINNEFLILLKNTLVELTGITWKVDVLPGPLGETIADKEAIQSSEQKKDILELPLVKAILSEFKGAKIESLTRKIVKDENSDEAVFGEESTFGEEDY